MVDETGVDANVGQEGNAPARLRVRGRGAGTRMRLPTCAQAGVLHTRLSARSLQFENAAPGSGTADAIWGAACMRSHLDSLPGGVRIPRTHVPATGIDEKCGMAPASTRFERACHRPRNLPYNGSST